MNWPPLKINHSTSFIFFFFLAFHSFGQINIKAVGDIMLGSQTPRPVIPPDSGNFFKDSIASYFDCADIRFGNLEGVFVNGDVKPTKCSEASRNAGRCYEFGMPEKLAPILTDLDLNVVSQDNNHVTDYGYSGIKNTKRVLDSLDIKCMSKKGYETFEICERKIALVAFGFSSESYQVSDLTTTKEVITSLKDTFDLVIVSFHGGAEGSKHTHTKDETEIFYGENRGNLVKFSHTAIDAGADLILGHGPHVLRAMEVYKNKLICYSLGNFLTYGNVNIRGVNGLTTILNVYLDEDSGDLLYGDLIPAKQVDRGIPVFDADKGAIKEIKMLSSEDFPNSPLIISDDGALNIKE